MSLFVKKKITILFIENTKKILIILNRKKKTRKDIPLK